MIRLGLCFFGAIVALFDVYPRERRRIMAAVRRAERGQP